MAKNQASHTIQDMMYNLTIHLILLAIQQHRVKLDVCCAAFYLAQLSPMTKWWLFSALMQYIQCQCIHNSLLYCILSCLCKHQHVPSCRQTIGIIPFPNTTELKILYKLHWSVWFKTWSPSQIQVEVSHFWIWTGQTPDSNGCWESAGLGHPKLPSIGYGLAAKQE